MFCPDGVVDIPEACGAKAQRAFNPGSNPGRDVYLRARKDAGVRLKLKDCSHCSRKWLRKSPELSYFFSCIRSYHNHSNRACRYARFLSFKGEMVLVLDNRKDVRNVATPRSCSCPVSFLPCGSTVQQSRSPWTVCRHVSCHSKMLLIFHTNGEIITGESYG